MRHRVESGGKWSCCNRVILNYLFGGNVLGSSPTKFFIEEKIDVRNTRPMDRNIGTGFFKCI